MNRNARDLEKYLHLPYTITLRPDEEGDVIAEVKELKGCTAHGADAVEALENLEKIKTLYIEDLLQSGARIPEPEAKEILPSGRWVQRVPRSVHKKLTELAEDEGVSLNQLVSNILSEAVGRRKGVAAQAAPQAVFRGEAKNFQHAFATMTLRHLNQWDFVEPTCVPNILEAENAVIVLSGIPSEKTVTMTGLSNLNYLETTALALEKPLGKAH